MLAWFERLVDPYPEAPPATPPRGFFAFVWACSQGLRKYVLAMTLLTAAIGAFEALLFSMMAPLQKLDAPAQSNEAGSSTVSARGTSQPLSTGSAVHETTSQLSSPAAMFSAVRGPLPSQAIATAGP